MAEQSNTGFLQEGTLESALNRHAISFQTGAINSTSEIIPMGNYYLANNNAGNMIFSGNSGIINSGNLVGSQAGNSHGTVLFNSVPGLKHDAGLATEWSAEEQYKLEEDLVRFADEPSIMRYIKIAATLPEKSVRDVALRCRWMTRKRRKQEESYLARKGNYRKDKLAELSSKANLPSTSMPNMAPYSFPLHQMDQEQRQMCRALSVEAKQLLELNDEAFSQIRSNLFSLKLQDNIGLLCRTRDNIDRVCGIMSEMPGRVRQMRELPVSINQELADSILPRTAQTMLFCMPNDIQCKQERTC
ncbi:hypothetical protein Nepgr_008916 [Nepenthes gracilis]|uniref:Uncharacterized protein n=1 Tax=Nepenthes gracilis TaxID=150966 RepID=A0AAD3S9V1_NEPGR|nr:hypothetical protein Nepgr_008916 [Nepenthes gracilis]